MTVTHEYQQDAPHGCVCGWWPIKAGGEHPVEQYIRHIDRVMGAEGRVPVPVRCGNCGSEHVQSIAFGLHTTYHRCVKCGIANLTPNTPGYREHRRLCEGVGYGSGHNWGSGVSASEWQEPSAASEAQRAAESYAALFADTLKKLRAVDPGFTPITGGLKNGPNDFGGDYCECCDPDVKWCKNKGAPDGLGYCPTADKPCHRPTCVTDGCALTRK